MKKLLIACAAVMTAAVAMATMSFAAYTPGVTKVSLEDTAGKVEALNNQELTVIVVPADASGNFPSDIDDDQILYINQGYYEGKTSENNKISFTDMQVKKYLKETDTTLTDGLTAGDYYIAIGGTDVTDGDLKIITEKFSVVAETTPPAAETKTVLWGDIDQDGEIALGDMTAVVYGILGKDATYKDYAVGQNFVNDLIWGDVDNDGEVALGDMTAVVYGILGKDATYGDYTVGQDAKITIEQKQ